MLNVNNPIARVLSLLSVVAIIGVLGACAGSRTEKSTGEYVDDAVVTTKVKTALANELGADSVAEIDVDTFKGVVQLSGSTDTDAERQQAVAIASGVDGVQRVKSTLSVKP